MKKIVIINAILLVIAVALGLGIFIKNSPKKEAVITNEITPTAVIPPNATPNKNNPVTTTEYYKNLSEDEKKVLVYPDGGTKEQKQEHSKLVQKMAKMIKSVDITGCEANPVVVGTVEGGDLTFVNKDNVEHDIVINPQNIISVPAKGQKKIIASFGHGFGIYGYSCDTLGYGIGIISVSNRK